MAVIQIPNLPAAIALNGNEQLEIVQGGVSRRAYTQMIANLGVTTNPSLFIPSMVVLRGTTPSDTIPAYLEGYYAIGDGGGGYFFGSTGQIPGTYVDNGGTIIVPNGGDGSSAWLRALDKEANILWFGADPTGINDSYTAISSAISSANTVYIPSGTYKISDTLTVTDNNKYIYGDGYSSVISPSFTNKDVFLIGDGISAITGLLFKDFKINPTSVMSTGYGFNCRYTTTSKWDNVIVGSINDYGIGAGKLYNGYYFNRFGQILIFSGEVACQYHGITANGNADQSFGAELSIDGGIRVYGETGASVYLGGSAGGVYLERVNISDSTYGVYCDNTLSGSTNRELFLQPGCTIDSCQLYGLNLEANSLALLEANTTWIAGCKSSGIRIAHGSNVSARWTGLRCYGNKYDGIDISDGAHVFSGGFVQNNGGGASGGHGIYIGSAAQTIINGVMIHNNGSVARGYGIYIEGTVNNYNIENCALFSNAQGVIYQPSGPSNTQLIRGNRGNITENSGVVTLPIGVSTATVNHGLADVPTNVLITFAGPQEGNSYVYTAPSSFTSTTFTLVYSAVPTGVPRSFFWRATRGTA